MYPRSSSTPATFSESWTFIWQPNVSMKKRLPATAPEVRRPGRTCSTRIGVLKDGRGRRRRLTRSERFERDIELLIHHLRFQSSTAEKCAGPRNVNFQIAASGSYQPKTQAKINGATMVASDSMTNRGVSTLSFPQVIFSLGTAPE